MVRSFMIIKTSTNPFKHVVHLKFDKVQKADLYEHFNFFAKNDMIYFY